MLLCVLCDAHGSRQKCLFTDIRPFLRFTHFIICWHVFKIFNFIISRFVLYMLYLQRIEDTGIVMTTRFHHLLHLNKVTATTTPLMKSMVVINVAVASTGTTATMVRTLKELSRRRSSEPSPYYHHNSESSGRFCDCQLRNITITHKQLSPLYSVGTCQKKNGLKCRQEMSVWRGGYAIISSGVDGL